MENEKVFAMSFSKVYGLLIAKAERKGRTRAEALGFTSMKLIKGAFVRPVFIN